MPCGVAYAISGHLWGSGQRPRNRRVLRKTMLWFVRGIMVGLLVVVKKLELLLVDLVLRGAQRLDEVKVRAAAVMHPAQVEVEGSDARTTWRHRTWWRAASRAWQAWMADGTETRAVVDARTRGTAPASLRVANSQRPNARPLLGSWRRCWIPPSRWEELIQERRRGSQSVRWHG